MPSVNGVRARLMGVAGFDVIVTEPRSGDTLSLREQADGSWRREKPRLRLSTATYAAASGMANESTTNASGVFTAQLGCA